MGVARSTPRPVRIFAGGLTVGAGIMLLRGGEALRGRPGIVMGAGVACMVIASVAPVVLKEIIRRTTAEPKV